MSLLSDRDQQMWKTSVALAGLSTASGMIATIGFIKQAPSESASMLTLSVVALLTLVSLLISGRRTRTVFSVFSFLLCTGVALGSVWMNHTFYFRMGQPFELFAGDKLFALGVGLIAPPILWVGLTAIIAAGVVPIIQFFGLSSEIRHGLPFQEPWLTYTYIVVGFFIYVYRLKGYEANRRAAQTETRAHLVQQFAQLLIHFQHLVNTPLQTLENGVAIFQERHAEDDELTAPMKRALARVREVMQLLSYCDSHVNWEGIELPKSVEELEKRMKNLINKERN